jgi:hypothetical protein
MACPGLDETPAAGPVRDLARPEMQGRPIKGAADLAKRPHMLAEPFVDEGAAGEGNLAGLAVGEEVDRLEACRVPQPRRDLRQRWALRIEHNRFNVGLQARQQGGQAGHAGIDEGQLPNC